MIRLDTAFHAFVANDQLAAEITNLQNGSKAVHISVPVNIDGATKYIYVALVREDEPKEQVDDSEKYLRSLS